MVEKFIKYLKVQNLSVNTISAYEKTISMFYSMHEEITKKNLLAFKGYLLEKYKPKTVNLRIQAVNKYLEFIKKRNLKLSAIKLQQKTFLENVISDGHLRSCHMTPSPESFSVPTIPSIPILGSFRNSFNS